MFEYTESERQIFGPYFNGEAQVWADPLRVHRILVMECGGDLNGSLARSDPKKNDSGTVFQATEVLMNAAVKALGLKPFDPTTGEGILEKDITLLLNSFLEYLGKKEKRDDLTPTSPPATDSVPVVPAMGSTSPSGLTSTESTPSGHGLLKEVWTMPILPVPSPRP